MLLHHNPPPEEEFYDGTHINLLWHLELLIMANLEERRLEHLETSRTGHLGPLERILWGRSLPGGCAAASPPSPASEEGVLRGVGGFTLAGSHGWLLLSTPIVAVEHRPNISPHYTGGSGGTALQNISPHYTNSGTSGTHTSSSGTSGTALHHSRGEPRCSRSKKKSKKKVKKVNKQDHQRWMSSTEIAKHTWSY